MWGNLKSSIANAGENGIIAKLGDVVAPQLDDDDDQYDSESGSGEYDEEEEQYEYYGDEDLDGIDDNDLMLEGEGEEEEINYDQDQEQEHEYDHQNEHEHEHDENGMQFSPSKLKLNEGRAAMGKLFGGVLQKGREKLNETARNLVERELSAVNAYSHEDDVDEGVDEGVDEDDGGGKRSLVDINGIGESEGGNEDKDEGENEDECEDQSETKFIASTDPVQNDEDISGGDEYITKITSSLSHDDELSTSRHSSSNNNIPSNESKPESRLDSETEAKEEILLNEIAEKNQMKYSFTPVVDADADVDMDVEMDVGLVNDSTKEVQVAAEDLNVKEKDDATGKEVSIDAIECESESEIENDIKSVSENDIEEEDSQYSKDSCSIDCTTSVEEEIRKREEEEKQQQQQDLIKEDKVTVQEEEVEEEEEGNKVEEQDSMEENHNNVNDTNVNTSFPADDTVHLDGDNAEHINMHPSPHMMENGNDPSAVEILDETFGHAFNLQETGLDKTSGHVFNLQETGLDQTSGHAFNLQETGLDQTSGHAFNLQETGLDQTSGHTFNLQETGLDQTSGHHLEIIEQHDAEEQYESVDYPTVVEPLEEYNENQTQTATAQQETAPEVMKPYHNQQQQQQNGTEKVEITKEAMAVSKEIADGYKNQVSTLESELAEAQRNIQILKEKSSQVKDQYREKLREMKDSHREDKEFLVKAAQETHAEEIKESVNRTREDMEKYILDAQKEMALQMEQSDQQLEQFRLMFEEATSRADKAEAAAKKEATKHSHQLAEMEKRNSITLERLEKKAGKAMSALEDKDSQIKELNIILKDLKNTIKQNAEDHEAVEDEADELHQENEDLKEKVEAMEKERKKMKIDMKKLQEESGKSLGVQIEVQLLKEELEREKGKAESMKETQTSNQSSLIAERDAAKAAAQDLEQRLTVLQADMDLTKSDYERSIMANTNLQAAMEAFQIERESELTLLEEARESTEQAMAASNELALQSMRQENEAAMKEVQIASNNAIQNMMTELQLTEQKVEEYMKETINLRRSLDEAIHRLQTNQEDVIDRSLMKNILLDWHSKSGKARRDVMVVVASVLHFSEVDKDKCGIGEGSSTIGKVVDAVAPPLTPAAKKAEELDGDNIREKWVNFLLAECGDSPQKEEVKKAQPVPKTKGRQSRSTQSLEL